MAREWNNRLFDYMSDPMVFLVSCLIPCGPVLLQAAAVDNVTHGGKMSPYCMIMCLGGLGAALNRETIRKKLDLQGNCMSSYCTWCCCGVFAAVQEYNESVKASI